MPSPQFTKIRETVKPLSTGVPRNKLYVPPTFAVADPLMGIVGYGLIVIGIDPAATFVFDGRPPVPAIINQIDADVVVD